MTSKDFLRGLGALRASQILEADVYEAPRRRPWVKWVAAAACVAIVATAAWQVLPRLTSETAPPTVGTEQNPEGTGTPGPDGSEAAEDEANRHEGESLGGVYLGMTREEAEKLRARLGLPEPPDSFYLEYEEGRLSRIGLNAAENVRILYRGLDLIHTHAEDVIAALSKESGFVCDCADHDLADTYDFPALGLELWREEPYHPKLLEEPGFQRMLARDPFTDYRLGWYFLQVWVQADQFRADFPLRECPAPDYDSWFLQQEEPEPIPPERLAAVAKKYGLEPPGVHGRGEEP